MKQVLVLEEATADLEEGRAFYDRLELGIGDYFFESLLSDLERLRLFHGFHSRHFGCLRALSGRFPFGIYYLDEPQTVRVLPFWTFDAIQTGYEPKSDIAEQPRSSRRELANHPRF